MHFSTVHDSRSFAVTSAAISYEHFVLIMHCTVWYNLFPNCLYLYWKLITVFFFFNLILFLFKSSNLRNNEGWLKYNYKNNTTFTLKSHTIVPWGYNQPAVNQTIASHLIYFWGNSSISTRNSAIFIPQVTVCTYSLCPTCLVTVLA